MEEGCRDAVYKVLSSDNLIYGPINLATLVQWVQERRVLRETWVHWETEKDWVAAGAIDALQSEFSAIELLPHATPVETTAANTTTVALEDLRGFQRFAPYSNEDLAILIKFCDVVMAKQGDVIIKHLDLSDSMFFVISGKVRARIRVGGHDTSLGVMEAGEVFGEVAMLSQTPRSADVVAEGPTRLLRLTSERFHQLMDEHSRLAARLLYNMARLLATRLSDRNKEMQKDLASAFVWR
jgi:hypothetical protein